MKINFVTHYVTLSDQELQNIRAITPHYTNYNSEKLMGVLFESIKILYPDANLYVLTDLETQIALPSHIRVKRYPLPKKVISSQISAYLKFIAEWDRKDPLVFIDWDMILQRNIDTLFDDPCDLMFTFRLNQKDAINTGLIIIPARASEEISSIFNHVLHSLNTDPEFQKYEWIGDQLVLSELFQEHLKNPVAKIFKYKNLKIRLLECAKYNFPLPKTKDLTLYPEKYIMHFKGKRKYAMLDYWKEFLQSKKQNSPTDTTKVTFVTQYLELNEQILKKVQLARAAYTYKKFPKITNPEVLINIQYQSIKKFHPDSKYILLTNAETKLKLDPDIEVIRQPMESQYVDYELLKSKIYFLKHTSLDTHVIFLEWDMLIQDNLDHIFESQCDLYLTFRDFLPFPINDGFIGVRKQSRIKVSDLLDFFSHRYKQFSSFKFYNWYGFQMILKYFFFEKIVELNKRGEDLIIDYPNYKIQFIDGTLYNYNPAIKSINYFRPEKKVIHFSKGKKRMMLAYWQYFLKNYTP